MEVRLSGGRSIFLIVSIGAPDRKGVCLEVAESWSSPESWISRSAKASWERWTETRSGVTSH